MKKNGAKGGKPLGGKKWAVAAGTAILVCACALAAYFRSRNSGIDPVAFQEKAAALREEALADWMRLELGTNPAGSAGYAVFFSVSDGTGRADVRCGTGETADEAWDNAVTEMSDFLRREGSEPRWVKADVVFSSQTVTEAELSELMKSSGSGSFRRSVALKPDFSAALLEAELNGAEIYDYDEGKVSLQNLNRYLKESGRKTLKALPEDYTLFQTAGWICDEDGTIYRLSASGQSFGRRIADSVDADYAAGLIQNAAVFLGSQVREDGSVASGYYPCFDEEIGEDDGDDTEDTGGIAARHAGAVLSLLHCWSVEPDDELKQAIDRAAGRMIDRMAWRDDEAAYFYEEEEGEITLSGCALAVAALTEYMDVFGTDGYKDTCLALGEGILSMMDEETGSFCHAMQSDFTPKEGIRGDGCGGEAVYALCRLYALSGEEAYLDAARNAADYLIGAGDADSQDADAVLAMNELTKYVTDEPKYYEFALENAENCIEDAGEAAISPERLELLIAAFEVYDRLQQSGAQVDGFDAGLFLETLRAEADRQLNGYFFPECAMYMANPEKVLGAFMAREDAFRARTEDTWHGICGYYMYWKNYERLAQVPLY